MSFKSLMCSLKWLIQMLLQCFNKIYEQYLKESNVDALQEQSTDHQIWKSNYHFYTNCHVKPMIVSIDLNTFIFDIDSNGQTPWRQKG